MNIQDIIKNQDILDCWKEIQKSNIDKNISKEVFEYDIEEYHTFLLDENEIKSFFDDEKFLEEKSEWILKNQQKMRERNLKNPKKNLSETEILEMKNNLKKYIIPKVAEWHKKTDFPAYGTIKITKSETRWGSCSGKNNLNFDEYELTKLEKASAKVKKEYRAISEMTLENAKKENITEADFNKIKSSSKILSENMEKMVSGIKTQNIQVVVMSASNILNAQTDLESVYNFLILQK